MDWDAATYDRIAAPQERWGLAVLDRLPLTGGERVLDAGCGSGRVTEHLLRRLGPHGSVVALDASAAMLAEARRRLGPWGRQVTYVHADLASPLVGAVGGPVDAILSTATFHWVTDHDALFANLAAALKPGGALVAQCGGPGNVAAVLEASARLGRPLHGHHFATPDQTRARLEASGFGDRWVWLSPEVATFEPGQLEVFLAAVVLRQVVDALGPDERSGFVRAVIAQLPRAELDYVRLNILARRR